MGGRRRDEVSIMHDNFPLANRFQQCVGCTNETAKLYVLFSFS